jgi:hypothetical protein
MWTPAARRPLAVVLALAAAAGPARAQLYLPPPPSTLAETSIRAAAMGGAGGAVMWGEPAVWANPATLSGVNGIGWVTGHTEGQGWVPGILPPRRGVQELDFSSQRLLIGGGGLAFSLMGKPISGLGKAEFDPNDLFVPPIGPTITVSERTEGWGVGVSPLRLIESIRKIAKMSPSSLTSYGDVAFGYQAKDSKAIADPDILGFGFDEAGTYDWGASGRLALARWWGPDAPFRLDLSGAYSQLNVIKSKWNDSGATTQQIDRFGTALHLSPAPPSQRSASPPSLPWWRPGDVPELSVGLAYDHEHHHDEPVGFQGFDVDHYGFETNVFQLLALRVGFVSDPEEQLEGWTYGGGISVPIGPWGSVGYQLASVPTSADADRPLRQGWSVWLDPTRFFTDGH